MKITTKHLSCEHGFVSIVQQGMDDIDCGRLDTDVWHSCYWPREMGDEPDWFFDELCELYETVKTEQQRIEREMRDYESQVNADYLRAKGAK
jgi:hypothetical protein